MGYPIINQNADSCNAGRRGREEGEGNVLLPAPRGLPEKHKKHKKHVNKRMPPGIDARGELTTACFVEYGGVRYDVTRIDTFEGYKQVISLHFKRK